MVQTTCSGSARVWIGGGTGHARAAFFGAREVSAASQSCLLVVRKDRRTTLAALTIMLAKAKNRSETWPLVHESVWIHVVSDLIHEMVGGQLMSNN